MMRAALIYSGENKKMDTFKALLLRLFEHHGNELKVFKANQDSKPNNFSSFDFVLTGCSGTNSFKGRIPLGLKIYLQKSFGLERKKSIVFIVPKIIGNEKMLKNLMSILEKKGSFVIDFLQIKNPKKDSELLFSHLK